MDTPVLLSVIVPIYNIEAYLEECIDSILEQKIESMEVLLIDDGSTDSSGRLCDERAVMDSRIKVVHKPNGGVNTARNAGLNIAQGRYITMIDGDDYIKPGTFIEALDCIESNDNIDLVQYPEIRVNHEIEQRPESYPQENVIFTKHYDMLLSLIGPNPMLPGSLWGKIYKRELWDNLRLREDMQFCEDMYILPTIMLRCNSIAIITHGGGYCYVVRDGSATHSFFTPKKCLDCFRFNATLYGVSLDFGINTGYWWNEACFAAIDAYAYWGPSDEIKEFLIYLQRTKNQIETIPSRGKLVRIAKMFTPSVAACINTIRMSVLKIRR